jgi:outer membrane protein assembly factor BamA
LRLLPYIQRFWVYIKAPVGFLLVLTTILFARTDVSADSVVFGKITINSDRIITVRTNQIQEEFTDQTVTEQSIDNLTTRLLRLPMQQGYYFPVLQLEKVLPSRENNYTAVNPVFRLEWGDITTIDTIIFQDVRKTRPQVLNRMIKEYIGKRYTPIVDKQINRSLNRFTFIMIEQEKEIVKTREGKTALLCNLRELQENEFSGIVGYIPETINQKGYFTGELDLKFHNLSGTGRQLALYWSKTSRYSQQIRMNYFEPWIWKSNMFGETGFEQILRDTLVVIRKFNIGTGFYSLKWGSIQFLINRESSLPTPGGKDLLSLTTTMTNAFGLKYKIDRRNNFYNPTGGVLLKVAWNAGLQQRESIENKIRSEFLFDAEVYLPVKSHWIFASSYHFKGKWLINGSPRYSDQYWFGGAGSLRGYSNDFFQGTQIAWVALEIRRLIDNLSSFILFYDQGYYRQANMPNYPHSFGVGIRLASRMGVIGLDYGFGKGDTFSTAKIHIRLINRF